MINIKTKYMSILLIIIISLTLGCTGTSKKESSTSVPDADKSVLESQKKDKQIDKSKLDLSELDEFTKEQVYEIYTGWVLCDLANRKKDGLKYLQELTELVPNSSYFQALLAQEYFRQGKRDSGMEALNKAIESNPDNIESLLLMGDVLRMESDNDGALEQYEKALQLDPNNIRALQEISAIYYNQNKFTEARNIYNKLLQIDPSSSPVYYHNVGQCLFNEGKYPEAADFFLKVIEIRPYYINTYFSLGQVYEKLGESEKAITTYEDLLQYKPNFEDAHKRLGYLYFNSQQYTKALQEFIYVVRSDPYYFPAKKYLGILLIFRGDYKLAGEYLDLYLEHDGNDVEANYYRALAAEQMGQEDLAKNLFEKILTLDPDHLDSYMHLADIALREKDYDRVIFLLTSAEPQSATNENLFYFRGMAYKFKGEYEKAEKDLFKAMELSEDDSQVMLQLALMYDETDQVEKSENILRKYISTNPENAEGYNFLGYMFAERGIKLDDAEELIKKALELKPESGDIIDSMGWVYYQKGMYNEALEMLIKAFKTKGDDPTILEHIGDAYSKLGEKDKALEAYKKSLETDDSNEEVKQKILELELEIEN